MGVEFVGVELELRGEEAVYSDLQKIDRLLNSLGGRKKVDAGLQNLKRDILAARGELEKFQRLRQKYLDAGGKGDAFSREIQEAKYRLKDLQQAQREVTLANRQMGDTFKQTFNRISSGLTHAGSKMQTLGNALQKLTSPFERLTTGLLYGAGYKALNMLTSGFSGMFERYDVMKNYSRTLEAFGFSAEQAQTSVEALNEAVLGLPTGLDEIVAAQKVYVGATNDLTKATDLAIAANNTFLASGTEAREQRFVQRYLVALGSGAELAATQWQSMARIAPLAMRAVSKELGYADKDYQKFISDVKKGTVAGEDFLNAFIKVGKTGTISDAANVMKMSFEGLSANIQNATKRMGEGILKSLDEVFTNYNGRTLLQNLLGVDANGNEIGGGVKHAINDVSEAVQGWIKSHPEEILDFINDFKAIDWKGFVKGLAEGMGEMAKAIQSFAKFASGKDLSGIGKMMIRLNMAGKFFTVFGGLVKGLSHPLAGIASVFIRGGRSFKRGGFMGMLGDLIAGESLSSLGDAEKKIDTAAPMMGKFSGKLSKFFTGWAQVATMIGGSAFVGWGSMKLFKGTMQSFKETVNIINEIDWDTGKKALLGLGGFLGAMAGLSGIAGHFASASGTMLLGELVVGVFSTLALGFADIDMRLLKDTLKQMKDATSYLNPIIDNLNNIKEVPDVKGKIGNAIEAFNGLTKLFRGGRNEQDPKLWENGLQMFDKKYADSLKNMSDAMTNIQTTADALNKINGMTLDTSNIETMMTNLSTAMDQVGGLYDMLPESITTGDAIWKGENINQSLTNIQNIFNKLAGEGGILSQIPRITQRIGGLQRSGQLQALGSQLDSFKEAMKGIWSKLNMGLSDGDSNVTQLTNLETALGKVKSIINRVNAIGGMRINRNGTANIRAALDSIKNAFSGANVAGITGQINAFVESIKTALQALKDLNEEIQINVKVKLSPAFESSVKATIRQINNGKKRIRATRTAVSFTIPVRVTFSVSTNLGSALGVIASARNRLSNAQTSVTNNGGGGRDYQGQATGGMIYRAKGGSIGFPGRPRGVDKVPVWAQAGEFMHRKQAVNLFGIDFMRKVNNLDMRGAMQELMVRAGNIANVGKNTVINNYYNNNQKVTQNINTNSSDFAFRSASRFAGAFK